MDDLEEEKKCQDFGEDYLYKNPYTMPNNASREPETPLEKNKTSSAKLKPSTEIKLPEKASENDRVFYVPPASPEQTTMKLDRIKPEKDQPRSKKSEVKSNMLVDMSIFERFIHAVINDRYGKKVDHFNTISIKNFMGGKIVKSGIANGFFVQENVDSVSSSGKSSHIDLLDKAYELVGVKPKRGGKGSYSHNFYVHRVSQKLIKKQYKVSAEFMGADLYAVKGEEKIAIEIMWSPPIKKEIRNFLRDEENKFFNKIIMLTKNKVHKKNLELKIQELKPKIESWEVGLISDFI